jgi:hypothetical protein
MFGRKVLAGTVFVACAALVGCGGGGGGGIGPPPPTATAPPTPTPTPVATIAPGSSSAANAQTGIAPTTATLPTIAAGYGSTVSLPATGTAASLTFQLFSTLPTSTPALAAAKRSKLAIGGTLNPLAFITVASGTAVRLPSTPAFSFTLPANLSVPAGSSFYIGFFDPAVNAWQTIAGPGVASGQTVTFGPGTTPISLAAAVQYVFGLFTTAQTLTIATPTPAPTAPAVAAAPPVGPLAAITGGFGGSTLSTSTTAQIVGVSGTNAFTDSVVSTKPSLSVTVFGSVSAASSAALALSTQRQTQAVAPFYHMLPERDPLESFREFQRLAKSAGGVRATKAIRRPQSVPTTLNSTASLWVQNAAIGASAGTYVQEPATLARKALHGDIWVDNSLVSGPNPISSAGLDAIANDFDNAYVSDTTHFGSPNYSATAPVVVQSLPSCDATGTPTGTTQQIIAPTTQIVVFVVDPAKLGNGVGGYFDPTNLLPQAALNCTNKAPATQRMSNEVAMFYLGYAGPNLGTNGNSESFEVNEDVVRGTAHEFQHLLNFVNKVLNDSNKNGEDRWVDEGMSMLAQDLAVPRLFPTVKNDVLDAMFREVQFLQAPQNYSLTGFSGIDTGLPLAFNCSGCYGASFMFQRYLYDRLGNDAYLQAMYSGSATGLAHIATIANASQSSILSDFGIALAQSGLNKSTDPRFNITGTPVRSAVAIPSQLGPSLKAGALNGPASVATITTTSGVPTNVSSFVGGLFFVTIPAAGSTVTVTDPTGAYNLLAGIVQ